MEKSKSKLGESRNYTPLFTARPKGMSYQEYRERRAYQNAWLKERLKGFICYEIGRASCRERVSSPV